MDKIIALIIALIKNKVINNPKYLITVLICVCVLYTPKYFTDVIIYGIEQAVNKQQLEHNKLVNYRFEISSKIDTELDKLRLTLNADRAFLGEYSNSTIGFSGLPFLYFSIHNEKDKLGILPISNQYQKQNVSNFSFNSKLCKEKFYKVKDLNILEKDDPLLCHFVTKNGTRYLYMCLIESEGTPKGFLGVSFTDTLCTPDATIFYELSKSSRKILDLLDKPKNKNK